ncbi:MAG: RDD family protein [Alphaproteobacteria bacterium]|nr:MAG: RDD family protein [Alphaproteobacteria bacterium]
MVTANIWKRLLAWQLDVLVFFTVVWAIIPYTVSPWDRHMPIPNLATTINFVTSWPNIWALLPIVAFLLYRAIMECSRWQASIGHMCFGIKIVSEQDSRISFGTALARNFLIFLSSIIYFLDCVKASKISHTWHERITKTKTEHTTASAQRSYRSLLAVWVLAFGWEASRQLSIKSYITWLNSNSDYDAPPEQLQNFHQLAESAIFVADVATYAVAAFAIISFVLLIKTWLSNSKTALDNWVSEQPDSRLALIPFIVPTAIFIVTGGLSLLVLHSQTSLLEFALMQLK